jgi:hypothetical protein
MATQRQIESYAIVLAEPQCYSAISLGPSKFETAGAKTMNLIRLMITALWLGGGMIGLGTYFKRHAFIHSLPLSAGSEELKWKHKMKFFLSLASIAIGVWWAVNLLQ